ncbi:MAG TPA: DJ-1/PfpI family protein [Acidobacteriota bacterium]|nr:DJ-1/PfpI family protein [Acidobacteriota bacterium]
MPNVLVFLATGFEEMEAVIVVDVLRRAGATVTTAAIGEAQLVTGSHDIAINADVLLNELPSASDSAFDLIVLPGGQPGTTNLQHDATVQEWIRTYQAKERGIAAICAAPMALATAGVLKQRTFTGHPGAKSFLETEANGTYTGNRVEIDGKLVTSQSPGTAFEFALALVGELFSQEKAAELGASMLVRA